MSNDIDERLADIAARKQRQDAQGGDAALRQQRVQAERTAALWPDVKEQIEAAVADCNEKLARAGLELILVTRRRDPPEFMRTGIYLATEQTLGVEIDIAESGRGVKRFLLPNRKVEQEFHIYSSSFDAFRRMIVDFLEDFVGRR